MSRHSNYKPTPPLSDLNPGVEPVEFNVLVLVCEVAEQTSGGIYRPQDTKELEELAGIEGLLVAKSAKAGEEIWAEPKPRPGERVTFAKWAGVIVVGDDGRKYRLMKDKDITGVRRAQPVQLAASAA